jgi:hypothetical protein
MQDLNPNQTTDVMKHFPNIELSYETMSHKKVSPEEYPICLAIPYGKKAFFWFTYFQDKNVCLWLELNKEKKVVRVRVVSEYIPVKMALNTLFYGTIYDYKKIGELQETNETGETKEDGTRRQFFILEDVIYSAGIPVFKQVFSEKLGFCHDLFTNFKNVFAALPIQVLFPHMYSNEDTQLPNKFPYIVHHIQYRSLTKILPYVNHSISTVGSNIGANAFMKKTDVPTFADLFIPPPLPKFDFSKPQYRETAIFEVKADLQNDIYHLYAYGKSSERVYCGVAYIPNYKTSVLMNTVFRNIKENASLDALEESDDEDDFQDTRFDKYVDLQKVAMVECVYLAKFHRWAPVRVLNHTRPHGQIVHISKLVGSVFPQHQHHEVRFTNRNPRERR